MLPIIDLDNCGCVIVKRLTDDKIAVKIYNNNTPRIINKKKKEKFEDKASGDGKLHGER